MSGRFVSGGTIDSTGEVLKQGSPETHNQPHPPKNKEWEVVQQELEAERKRREEHRAQTAGGGEKSLYDILQENKAAKQAAFEEQNKLRNQFRALDDDEVTFLDEVREKQRQEEQRVRRETEEGLRAFRERQKSGAGAGSALDADGGAAGAAGDGADAASAEAEVEDWGVGKKRKRAKDREKELKGVKRRTSEGNAGQGADTGVRKPGGDGGKLAPAEAKAEAKPGMTPAPASTVKKPSALVAYGSDSDSD